MQSLRVAFLALLALLGTARAASASSVAERVSGRIVLQVQQNGEAWYVYPTDTHRYYLGRPDDAFQIMRDKGLGITNDDLATIPIGEISESGTTSTVSSVLKTIVGNPRQLEQG